MVAARSVYTHSYLSRWPRRPRPLFRKKKVRPSRRSIQNCRVINYLMFVCFAYEESPPEIVANGTDTSVEAEEGNFATLKCIAIGNPTPSVVWQKNTTLVSSTVDAMYLNNNVIPRCVTDRHLANHNFKWCPLRFWATKYFKVPAIYYSDYTLT